MALIGTKARESTPWWCLFDLSSQLRHDFLFSSKRDGKQRTNKRRPGWLPFFAGVRTDMASRNVILMYVVATDCQFGNVRSAQKVKHLSEQEQFVSEL